MERIGEVILTNGLLTKSTQSNTSLLKENFQKKSLSKKDMWNSFRKNFYIISGKKLIENDEVISNIKTLFYYFLEDNKFFNCDNLKSDITVPSFKKGLLLIGGYGVGKTDYFKAFEATFKNYNNMRFKGFTSKELVLNYELCQTPNDKEYFFKNLSRKRIFIDDITSEREANNYGKVNVIEEVLSLRYEKKLKTYATCNYSNKNQCVSETMEHLGNKYGARIYDRLFESFNIVEFSGKSIRK